MIINTEHLLIALAVVLLLLLLYGIGILLLARVNPEAARSANARVKRLLRRPRNSWNRAALITGAVFWSALALLSFFYVGNTLYGILSLLLAAGSLLLLRVLYD